MVLASSPTSFLWFYLSSFVLYCSLSRMANQVICGMDGAYTPTAFLAKIHADSSMKSRCESYKKLPYMGPPCPTDPKDVKGWMKHFGAKVASRGDCVRRIKTRKMLSKLNDRLYTRRNKCYNKCDGLRFQKKNGKWEEKEWKRCLTKKCSKEERAIVNWDKKWKAATY
jgi:hypothetical protein